MDYKAQIAIIIAVAVIVVVLVLRHIFTKGSIEVNRRGVKGTLEANPNVSPPAPGVDLSEAEFKDRNRFEATEGARIKAPGMRAGSDNEFNIGTSKDKTESSND